MLIRFVVDSSYFISTEMSASTTEDSSVLQQAIHFLNSEFGDNVKSLKKARQLADHIKTTKTSLEEQVGFLYKNSIRMQMSKICHMPWHGYGPSPRAVRQSVSSRIPVIATSKLFDTFTRHTQTPSSGVRLAGKTYSPVATQIFVTDTADSLK